MDDRYEIGDGPRDRSLRVGDKERDAVGEILRRRHLEGRLDTEEFQARLEQCLEAKTYAELDGLIADFPPETTASPRTAQPWMWRPWPFALLPLAVIAAIVIGGHFVWLAVPLFFFFVVRPLIWRARYDRRYARGAPACGPRRTTRA